MNITPRAGHHCDATKQSGNGGGFCAFFKGRRIPRFACGSLLAPQALGTQETGGEFVGFGEEYWWERLNQCGRFAPWQRLDFNGLRELAPDAIKI